MRMDDNSQRVQSGSFGFPRWGGIHCVVVIIKITMKPFERQEREGTLIEPLPSPSFLARELPCCMAWSNP